MKKLFILCLCLGCQNQEPYDKKFIDFGKNKWLENISPNGQHGSDHWEIIELNYNGEKHVYLFHQGFHAETIIKVE